MKKMLSVYFFSAILALSSFGSGVKYNAEDGRNYFGYSWDSVDATFTYCKNVGYTHVMYKKDMELSPKSKGMFFYIETPEYQTYDRIINLTKVYPAEKIKEWESICAVAFPDRPFPKNMATGWFFSKDVVSLQLDMQQKKVHQYAIDKIMAMVKKITDKNPDFKFGGFSWDVPQPNGDFNDYRDNQWRNSQVTLKFWTGSDSTPKRPSITHDYKTYSDGYFEFYRALMEAGRKVNPSAKFFVEPYDVYRDWVAFYEGDFFKSKGADAKYYMPDFITSEGTGDKFATDERIYKSGLVSRDMIGSSSPDTFLEKDMRAVAGAAAKNGSWACFFLRYGGYSVVPQARSIREIPTRIKIGKLIPTWENLNNTALEFRSWDGSVYSSPTAFMSSGVYWAKQPNIDRIILVFNSKKGVAKIPERYSIDKIETLDGLFSPNGTANKKFITADGNNLRITDSSIVGQAFSLTLKKSQ